MSSRSDHGRKRKFVAKNDDYHGYKNDHRNNNNENNRSSPDTKTTNTGIIVRSGRAQDDDDDDNNNNEEWNTTTSSTYNRPRRPNQDTISYLISLPFDLQTGTDEITTYMNWYCEQQQQPITETNNEHRTDEDEYTTSHTTNNHNRTMEYPQSFSVAWTALMEIEHEIGSIASCSNNDDVCLVLEILIRLTVPYSLYVGRFLLQHCIKYWIHLSTHRYGSHIIQTIVQQCCNNNTHTTTKIDTNKNIAMVDLALHPDAPTRLVQDQTTIPSFTEFIMEICTIMKPYLPELAVHVCGSHVVRTVLCALGGVHVIVDTNKTNHHLSMLMQKNGKKKKKKAKKKTDTTTATDDNQNNSSNHTNQHTIRMMYTSHSPLDVTVPQIRLVLEEMALVIAFGTTTTTTTTIRDVVLDDETTTETKQYYYNYLHELLIHPSASPLLIVLLFVLTYNENMNVVAPATALPEVLLLSNQDEYNSITWPEHFQLWERFVTNTVQRHLGEIRLEPCYSMNSVTNKIVQYIIMQFPQPIQKENEEYNKEGMTKNKNNRLYELACERLSSHVLETILRISPDSVYEQILQQSGLLMVTTTTTNSNTTNNSNSTTIGTRMELYMKHPVCNFIVNTILVTIRTKEQMILLISSLLPLIQNGYILERSNRRRWTLWRMVEVIVKYSCTSNNSTVSSSSSNSSTDATTTVTTTPDDVFDIQTRLIQSIKIGFDTLEQKHRHQQQHQKPDDMNNHKKDWTSVSFQTCIRKLIGLQQQHSTINNESDPKVDDGKHHHHQQRQQQQREVSVDAAGIRTIYYLLQFDPTILQQHKVLSTKNYVQAMNANELYLLATDAISSLCYIEPIIDKAIVNNNSTTKSAEKQIWIKLVKQFIVQLHGKWIDIAIHRVGYHLVKKLFVSLSNNKDKEQFVREFVATVPPSSTNNTIPGSSSSSSSSSMTKLTSTSMGRSVVEALSLREYQSMGAKEWICFITDQNNNSNNNNNNKNNNGMNKSIATTTTTRNGNDDGTANHRKHQQGNQQNINTTFNNRNSTTKIDVVDSIFDPILPLKKKTKTK